MGEVAESEGRAVEVFQASVDRFGGSVAGAGPVEIGQRVSCSAFQGPSESGDLDHRLRDADADGLDQLLPLLAAAASVGLSVGGDHLLVDTPGGLHVGVVVNGEQDRQALVLPVGEQV